MSLSKMQVTGAKIIALKAVEAEMSRQQELWGFHDHPNGTSNDFITHSRHFRIACADAFENGNGTWADILTEEFYEVLAEEDPQKLKEELIQLAAVAVNWASVIELKQAGEL